ncbi:MAG: hypothetical protein HC802_10195 [Caldilineaceae bacterium]|nr:hypothetical protein [Caldilineaceae bacterium]
MNIRRYYVPNAVVFITQAVQRRQPVFQHPQYLELLKATMREAKERYPFHMLAYVFLPDHFHLLIRPLAPQPTARSCTRSNRISRRYTKKHWHFGFHEILAETILGPHHS